MVYFRRVSYLRLIWRFLFFAFFTTAIVVEIWLRRTFMGADMRVAMRVRRRWARVLLRNVGIRGATEGTAPDFACIIVCNHRSYLDPILMLRDVDAYPVAKAELADWPVIGKGALLAGILYLRRDHSGSRANALRLMEEKIRVGFQIILFPEGTTSGVHGTLPFKKGVFQLAARTGIPIVPAALIFHDKNDFWIGKQTFLRHAGRRFKEKIIRVDVCYGPTLRGDDAEKLLSDAKDWIDGRLGTATG
ncbi:MAG: 1-acyl-sn-glycerol-3-phosphate acyltransferase [Saprospiraceae bacterium]|nr:1-acyl-sn-glycerol-3-phosphate acyltransferase [Saprospiraceae bacterium]